MNKNKQQASRNQYKALYQLTRKKRIKQNQQLPYKEKTDDSLEKYTPNPSHHHQNMIAEPQNHFKLSKKSMHNRSNSCPFMNPAEMPIRSIKIIEDQSRRTLKKTSAKHNVPKHKKQRNMRQHQNNLHQRRIHVPLQHKYSGSQLSQQSNTVVVHPLPLEQLSSMLYSLNHEKEHESDAHKNNSKRQREHRNRFHKKSHAGINNTCQHPKQTRPYLKYDKQQTPSFTDFSYGNKYMIKLHNDLYFKTKLHHQIKLYDLNEDMKILKKETQNVRIRQDVLEKLAKRFSEENYSEMIDDGTTSYLFDEDSLVIH